MNDDDGRLGERERGSDQHTKNTKLTTRRARASSRDFSRTLRRCCRFFSWTANGALGSPMMVVLCACVFWRAERVGTASRERETKGPRARAHTAAWWGEGCAASRRVEACCSSTGPGGDVPLPRPRRRGNEGPLSLRRLLSPTPSSLLLFPPQHGLPLYHAVGFGRPPDLQGPFPWVQRGLLVGVVGCVCVGGGRGARGRGELSRGLLSEKKHAP